jgi:predicted Zn-dependent protease
VYGKGILPALGPALLFVLASSSATTAGARPKPKGAKDRRSAEAELLGIAELSESMEQHDDAIRTLDELRRLCAPPGPAPCESKDGELLEQIGWLCLKSASCAPRRSALLEEVRRRLPGAKELIADLAGEAGGAADAEAADDAAKKGAPPRSPKGPARIAELSAAVQQHPDDLDLRGDLADALFEDGQLGAAIPEYRALLARRDDEGARANLIDALEETGKLREAARELAIHLEHQPQELASRRRWIELLVDLNDKPAALVAVQRYLAERHEAYRMRWLEIELLEQLGRNVDADRRIADLVTELPARAGGWALLAERALAREDRRGAERALAKARALSSTDAETLEKIAEVDRDLGLFQVEQHREFRREVRREDFEDELRHGLESE